MEMSVVFNNLKFEIYFQYVCVKYQLEMLIEVVVV